MQIKQTNWLHCALPRSLSLLLLCCSCFWSCVAVQLLRCALYVSSFYVRVCVTSFTFVEFSLYFFSYILRCSFHDFGSRFDSCCTLPLSFSLSLSYSHCCISRPLPVSAATHGKQIIVFVCVCETFISLHYMLNIFNTYFRFSSSSTLKFIPAR